MFIPERFDPESKYYLTPDGKKRNPFSFSPFLGGVRICLGKTFVEEVSKVTLPNLLQKFDF
jgi:cytochrome P450